MFFENSLKPWVPRELCFKQTNTSRNFLWGIEFVQGPRPEFELLLALQVGRGPHSQEGNHHVWAESMRTMNCSKFSRSHFQWMMMCSSHFHLYFKYSGKFPHYLVENLNVKTTVWFAIDSGASKLTTVLISLEHGLKRLTAGCTAVNIKLAIN